MSVLDMFIIEFDKDEEEEEEVVSDSDSEVDDVFDVDVAAFFKEFARSPND
ncbi:hypothetical protein R6X41_02305 [Formosa sp. PL04]|nr:hypothetical protein [Formosa sp. PL04]MDW5287631.1 hypothetical protein [Formosa sp. PL04]